MSKLTKPTSRDFDETAGARPRRRLVLFKRLRRILLRVLFFLLLLEAGWFIVANLTQHQVVAQWRSIEKGCWTEALFIREERLVTVPADGKFISRVTSGSRVPQSEILGFIAPQGIDSGMADGAGGGAISVIAPQAGYWLTDVDGWEERLNPDDFAGLTEEDFARGYPLQHLKAEVSQGDVCGKIVAPFFQLIAVTVDPRRTGQPQPELKWRIVVRNDSDPVTIRKTIRLPDGRFIVILEDRALKFLQPERKLQVYLVYRRVSGISLPVQALYKKGKSYYVKIIKGVGYRAQKVELTASDGERAIIKGIDYGTTVISR